MEYNDIITLCLLLLSLSIYYLQKQIKILICLVGDIFKYIKEQKTERDNQSLELTGKGRGVSDRQE